MNIHDHLPELHEWSRKFRFPRICEIGVHTGNSTIAFLAGLELDGGGTLHSVDISDQYVPLGWRHAAPGWRFLKADSLSAEALAWVPRALDILFLDGMHDYERVLGELRAYGPRVVPGGVILCHDTELDAANDRLYAPDPKFPVVAAIQQWCRESVPRPKPPREWENRPGSEGLGVIRI